MLLFLTASYAQDTNLDLLRASDINGDGVVNILDLTLIASRFGAMPTEDQRLNPDVNADGFVNILDLTLVAGHLGKTIRPPVAFVSANPSIDSQLEITDTITLTFDNIPEDITVSTGIATITDKIVAITGPFDPGSLALTVTWTDGTQTLNYTIRQPAAFISVDPAIDSRLETDDTVTLTFDNAPEDVSVSTGTATITDKTVAITGPFDPGTLALTITWKDGTQTLNYTVRQPVAFVRAKPAAGATLTIDTPITLTFDNRPEDVAVSTGTATITGKKVEITGPFDPGLLALTITWKDGTQTLNYTVRQPVAFVRAKPAAGATLTIDTPITLTFDNRPEDVAVSTGTATITGKKVEITGPFDPGLLALTITWKDGTQTLNYTVRPPVAFVRANPAAGAELTVDDTIILTFDNRPKDLTVSTGDAKIRGKKVTITGTFDPGSLDLTITWADGSQTLTYTVATPDTEAPRITSGTVRDGDKSIDPEAINARARIEVEFSEEVNGNIALQTAAGVNAGWIGKVNGKKGTLELIRGKELDNGTTYVIVGKVSDAAGNETNLKITFATESKPKSTGVPFPATDATFNTLVLQSEIPVVVEFWKDG